MFLIPNYTIEDTAGKAGKTLWSFHKFGIHISCSTPQVIPFHTDPIIKNFNPYTDIQRGYVVFGFKGKNYAIKNYFKRV